SNNTHRELRFMYYPRFIDQTDLDAFRVTFEWLYRMVNTANMVISRAGHEGIDWGGATDAEHAANKESIVAAARFFRAWAYRHITYSFGDAPLSLEEIDGTNYRTDWERNPVAEIRESMEEDLRYAVDKLPLRAASNTTVSGALARHYLGELYLAMGRPDDARQVLQPLVEGSEYRLMTERFGTNAQQAGNAFIDVFRSPLYAEGNMEVLYAFLNTEPEVAAYGTATIYIKSSWKNYYSNDGVIRNSNQEAPSYVSGSVTWPQQFWLTNGGKGAGRAVPSLGAIRLYNYKGQG